MYDQNNRSATLEQADALRHDVSDLFDLQNTTLDQPQTGHILFRGRFLCDLADCFDELRRRFEGHGFTPLIRDEAGDAVLIAVPAVFNPPASNWLINLVLFILTVFSTLFVAASAEIATSHPGMGLTEVYRLTLGNLWLGWQFSFTLLLILGAHELGHYFAARYHRVAVTLPYFIPMPFSIIGTMGAFIRLKAPIKNRRALLDIGAAGPLAGMVFAVPILIIGLATSDVGPLPEGGYMLEGNSVFYALLKLAIFGRFLPDGNMDVMLNQVAWAGWVGLLVTGLNLFPVGQLDGGHVSYTIFGVKAKLFFWPVIITLGVLAFLARTPTWAVWVVLLFFLGRRHAEPLDDVTELDGRRRIVAIFTLALFLLVFIPIPLRIIN